MALAGGLAPLLRSEQNTKIAQESARGTGYAVLKEKDPHLRGIPIFVLRDWTALLTKLLAGFRRNPRWKLFFLRRAEINPLLSKGLSHSGTPRGLNAEKTPAKND